MTKRKGKVVEDDDEDESGSESDSPITITSTPNSIWLDMDGTTFNLDHIAAYRSAGDGRTSIWTPGQSSIDGGFLVDVDVEDISEAIREATLQQAIQSRALDNSNGVDHGDTYDVLSTIALARNKFD